MLHTLNAVRGCHVVPFSLDDHRHRLLGMLGTLGKNSDIDAFAAGAYLQRKFDFYVLLGIAVLFDKASGDTLADMLLRGVLSELIIMDVTDGCNSESFRAGQDGWNHQDDFPYAVHPLQQFRMWPIREDVILGGSARASLRDHGPVMEQWGQEVPLWAAHHVARPVGGVRAAMVVATD